MIIRKLLGGAALATMLAGAAFAQSAQPAQPTAPAKPAAPMTAPAAPAATPAAKPAAPTASTGATQTQKINLNTAPTAELDKLPQIGEARAKLIVEARAKAKFKDWGDFVARKVVPANAESAIKDKVTF